MKRIIVCHLARNKRWAKIQYAGYFDVVRETGGEGYAYAWALGLVYC